ncbi:CRISPR-associated protein Cas5d [Sulfobacillus thermosulfidooxidans DSM 9293]|uniref:pre-crRNA processing endonuclease n=1 Tax=Sulfobacillus thermosulfidooxidans (strain DSM 9293 / VKM B-1269 / AT-1) TaxID=929705 RepID=A0A1W1WIE1_SULTA|nr:type I-C CRISPR-associated protein Cas5c [Sulfobacillus thermosulfidooxidans]SMC05800.1 CRISPR-associated protein Cas5d [Sulfobacillus thermosulfidooxidans DSM 9293]
MTGLEIWGDFACFTRPELKVERFSYPVITPSAARGIFEAVYWKPEFRWVVDRIELLTMPRWIGLRRNEVKDKAPSERTIRQWMTGKTNIEPIWADGDAFWLGTDQKGRTQRQTMALQQPHYRVFAHIEPWPGYESYQRKFEAQFERRAKHGQCIYQPYLGCREFPAYFAWVDDRVDNPVKPIALDADWGWMLYDVFSRQIPGTPEASPQIQLFRCVVRSGVVEVPHYTSEEVVSS